jgi:putative membrane protein
MISNDPEFWETYKTEDMKAIKQQTKLIRLAAIAAFSAVLLTACWDNDKPDTPQLDDSEPVSVDKDKNNYEREREKDKKFLDEVYQRNKKEILLAELARDKASMSDVKDLAVMLIEDHNKSLNELNGLASREGIVLDTEQSEKAMDTHHKLSTKTGDDFDKYYIDLMVKSHEESISLFEDAANTSSDPEIREWADATLPTLRKHLEHVKFCEKKIKEYNS